MHAHAQAGSKSGLGEGRTPSPRGRAAGDEPENAQNGEETALKSQVSLAETCQEEKGRGGRRGGEGWDEEWLSVESQNYDCDYSELPVCQDFLGEGCCMQGRNCEWLHEVPSQPHKLKAQQVRLWLFQQIPELALLRPHRTPSFLA